MLIIFGGTFDPIHNGHLALASALYERLCASLVFMPVGLQTYKQAPRSSPQDRLQMLEIALSSHKYHAYFKIDTSELNSTERCYTYKTLQQMRQKIGAKESLLFVLGGDSLITLDTWDNWRELLNITNFAVIQRPNSTRTMMTAELLHEFDQRVCRQFTTDDVNATPAGKFFIIDFTPIDISSTQIRHNIKQHLPVADLLPAQVVDYITKHNLYLNHHDE